MSVDNGACVHSQDAKRVLRCKEGCDNRLLDKKDQRCSSVPH